MSFITSMLGHLNYGTIFILMLLESTVIPVPSELVVAPAAYHAAAGNLDILVGNSFLHLRSGCRSYYKLSCRMVSWTSNYL